MRLTLPNQQQIDNLSKPLGDSLRALKANVSACFDREHKPDGGHADILPDSVTSPVVRSSGRLIGGTVWSAGRPVLATTMPLTPDTKFLAENGGSTFFNVITFSTLGATPLVIHGIAAAGREPGERIVIANIGNGELQLIHKSTSSPLGTRFMSSNITTSVSGQSSIFSGGSIEAIYLRANAIPTAGYYWFLIGGEN